MIYAIAIAVASIVFGCEANQIQVNTADCVTLMKVHFNQSEHDFFSKYIHYTRYKTVVPDLNSFTLSFWVKFDHLDQNSTVFTYVESEYNRTLISVKYAPSFGWDLKILDKEVLLRTAPNSVNVGSWHHVLVSWTGKSSGLTFWLDQNHIGTHIYTQDEVIPGGGVVRSGHSELSIFNWDYNIKDEQPEGLNGWITLLNFDSKPFPTGNSDDAKHKVSYLMSSCDSPGSRGNIINWQSTPLKGYGSVTTHLASNICGYF